MLTRNKSNIVFELEPDSPHLKVTIETERLYLQPITVDYIGDYKLMLNDTIVMEKFADGKIWDAEKVKTRTGIWIDRWSQNNPFSSLAVFNNDDDKFIGHVILGHGEETGQSELAYVFVKDTWGKGYGKEAVSSVVLDYAPELVRRDYKLNGVPFTSIVATSRPDNVASVKILSGAGMKPIREEFKFGHNRQVFFRSAAELINLRANSETNDREERERTLQSACQAIK